MISLSSPASAFYIYCRSCARLRDVLYDAPWSSFDLIAGCITFWLGVYLIASPALFENYGAVYQVLSRFGNECWWGTILFSAGLFDLVVTLWYKKRSFQLRLLARMGIGFCMTSLALNNLANTPPPASTITYGVLALASIWSVLRTRSDGR